MNTNKKRFIAWFLTLIMLFPFVACSKKEAPTEAIELQNEEVIVTASTTEEPSPEESPIPVSPSEEQSPEETEVPGLENEEPITSEAPDSIEVVPQNEEMIEEPEVDTTGLTVTQRNSINMLNYMSTLTQGVNENKGDQLFLETAYNSFDNLYPNAVDMKTQAQITSLMDTIEEYRMISVRRARLEYIHEQNRAQAIRKAIPNPLGLLSAIQSRSWIKAIVSALYMTVDSATSYKEAINQADQQFLQEGWELDDAESAALHESTKSALNYLLEMVRTYDLPGDYALSREAIVDFVAWTGKPDSQLTGKIAWLESHEDVYCSFGPYWLELAQDYYNAGDYSNCLESVRQYDSVSTRIFRRDIDYATVLPMAIASAKETLSETEYIEVAEQYCEAILNNTKDSNANLRYFAAQIYLDLYALTDNEEYLDKAYSIALNNVVVLVDSQREMNAVYLADIVEEKPAKDATKREKKEIKEYNRIIRAERKTALPPVNEVLCLNCDLLFALAKERNISTVEKQKIDSILHVNGERLFLTETLDSRFWFDNQLPPTDSSDIDISFDSSRIILPASCITNRSRIVVTISGPNGTTVIDDWTVKEVNRSGKDDCSRFKVTLVSKSGKNYKFQDGETITVRVIPVEEASGIYIDFVYNAKAVKRLFVIDEVVLERVA